MKRRLAEAPLAKGVPKVIVPAARVELTPPPEGCKGGVSSVVPLTSTLHGAEPLQVTASLTPVTVIGVEVRARKFAVPEGEGGFEILPVVPFIPNGGAFAVMHVAVCRCFRARSAPCRHCYQHRHHHCHCPFGPCLI